MANGLNLDLSIFDEWRNWRPGMPSPSGGGGESAQQGAQQGAFDQAQAQGGSISPDQAQGWVNTIGGLFVSIAGTVAQLVNVNNDGSGQLANGQTVPPQNYVPTAPTFAQTFFSPANMPFLLLGGVMLLLVFSRRGGRNGY
jgi:hypothetical protein